MVVSSTPISWDFLRWRHTLEAYRIDGRQVFDIANAEDKAAIDRLLSMEDMLGPGATRGQNGPTEFCPDILARTAGEAPVTDDNMGTEWRYVLGLD